MKLIFNNHVSNALLPLRLVIDKRPFNYCVEIEAL